MCHKLTVIYDCCNSNIQVTHEPCIDAIQNYTGCETEHTERRLKGQCDRCRENRRRIANYARKTTEQDFGPSANWSRDRDENQDERSRRGRFSKRRELPIRDHSPETRARGASLASGSGTEREGSILERTLTRTSVFASRTGSTLRRESVSFLRRAGNRVRESLRGRRDSVRESHNNRREDNQAWWNGRRTPSPPAAPRRRMLLDD